MPNQYFDVLVNEELLFPSCILKVSRRKRLEMHELMVFGDNAKVFSFEHNEILESILSDTERKK